MPRRTPPVFALAVLAASLALPTPGGARPHGEVPKPAQYMPMRELRKPSLLVATTQTPLHGAAEAAVAPQQQQVSVSPRRSVFRGLVAYLLWLFFGMTGAHHLYLGRNKEAVLCSMTCGGFGLGWLSDAVRIPRFLRELAAAEAELVALTSTRESARDLERGRHRLASEADVVAPATMAGAEQGRSQDVADAQAANDAESVAIDDAIENKAALPASAHRLGCLSSCGRLIVRIAWRMMLGMWLSLHVANLLPEALLATASTGMFRIAASAAIFAALAQATIALTAATASRAHFPPAPLPTVATSSIGPATVAIHLAAFAASTASSVRSMIASRPITSCAIVAAALLESKHATGATGRGALPLVVAVLGSTVPTWREPSPATNPSRSLRSTGLALVAAALFWIVAILGALRKVDVSITVDGAESSINALRLLSCSACAARPDRLVHMLRTLTEHACIKKRLELALGRSFDRVCILPQQINRCFDWDHAGTRWQRIGLSLSEAYRALGLSRLASDKDVKVAFRKAALANHPDKVGAPAGSAAGEEAALTFMKAQKAYDRIMEARKPPAPKPKPAPPAPPKAASYYYGGSRGYRDNTQTRKTSRGKSSSSSSRPRSGRSKPRKP